jgi:ribonuclease VapC
VIVVDTSALLTILREEAETAAAVNAILGSEVASIGAPTAFEYLMVAKGNRQLTSEEKIERVLLMPRLQVVTWTPPLMDIAQAAFLKFGKGRHPAMLNYGDCMSYAVAKSLGCPLLDKGGDFAKTVIASAVAPPP